jgi:hypothetical protein
MAGEARTMRPARSLPGASGAGFGCDIAQRESGPSTPSAGGSSRPCAISCSWSSRGPGFAGFTPAGCAGADAAGGCAGAASSGGIAGAGTDLGGATFGAGGLKVPTRRRKKAAQGAAESSAMLSSSE